MTDAKLHLSGYLLYADEPCRPTLRRLRALLPPVGEQAGTPRLVSEAGGLVLSLTAEVHVSVDLPGGGYPGSLGRMMEDFIYTFLDSLRPLNPVAGRSRNHALEHWRDWPREMVCEPDEPFELGPHQLFGLVRLQSSGFEGEVTRAVRSQRDIALDRGLREPVVQTTWPRLAHAEVETGE